MLRPVNQNHLTTSQRLPPVPLQREDLKGEAIEGGLIEALMHVLRTQKAPLTASKAVGCLHELALERESWPRIIKSGQLRPSCRSACRVADVSTRRSASIAARCACSTLGGGG